jgi:MFS family permease
VLRDRTFVRVWLLTALLVTVGFAQLHAAFPAFTTSTGGISAAGLSIAFAANTFTVVAAQLLVLRWMAGRRRTVGLALVSGCWGLTWLVTLLGGKLGGGIPAVVVFALALAIFAVGETLLSPSLAPLVNDLASDELRGRYNGLYTLAWTTGFAAGPAIAGVVLGAGGGEVLMVGLATVCGLAVFASWRLSRHLTPVVNTVGSDDIPLGLPAAQESP